VKEEKPAESARAVGYIRRLEDTLFQFNMLGKVSYFGTLFCRIYERAINKIKKCAK